MNCMPGNNHQIPNKGLGWGGGMVRVRLSAGQVLRGHFARQRSLPSLHYPCCLAFLQVLGVSCFSDLLLWCDQIDALGAKG